MSKQTSSESIKALFRQVARLYDYRDYHHALAILGLDFADELNDVCRVLLKLRSLIEQVERSNAETARTEKSYWDLLRADGWEKRTLSLKLFINGEQFDRTSTWTIDYFKNRVAVMAPRSLNERVVRRTLDRYGKFFEHQQLSVGIIVARKPDIRNCIDKSITPGSHYSPPMSFTDVFLATPPTFGTLTFKKTRRIFAGCPILTLIPRSETN